MQKEKNKETNEDKVIENNDKKKKKEAGTFQTEDAPENHPDNTTGSMKILMD